MARKEIEEWWSRAYEAQVDGRLSEALASIERYREIAPDRLKAKSTRALYGWILSDARRFEEARRELRFVPTAEASLLLCRAWIGYHENRGHPAEAERWHRRLVESRPDETWGWIHLGACLARQGKLDEALTAHRHATTLEGDPDEAHLNVALILRARGEFAEAAASLRQSLRLCPDYPEASRLLADVGIGMTIRGVGIGARSSGTPARRTRRR